MKKLLLFGTASVGHDSDRMRGRQRVRGGAVWSASASALRRDGLRPRSRLCVDGRLLGPARRTLVLGRRPLVAPSARPRRLGSRHLGQERNRWRFQRGYWR